MNNKKKHICGSCKTKHELNNSDLNVVKNKYCNFCYKKGLIISVEEYERKRLKRKISDKVNRHISKVCRMKLNQQDVDDLWIFFDFFAFSSALMFIVVVILYFYILG
ncbi:hypothetical protein GQ473_04135 [archaeon]|nr:hypothetical protein [archaeon]